MIFAAVLPRKPDVVKHNKIDWAGGERAVETELYCVHHRFVPPQGKMFPWENVVRVPFHAEVPGTPFPCSLLLISMRLHGVMEGGLYLELDVRSSSRSFSALLEG